MFRSPCRCKILIRKFNKAVDYFPKFIQSRLPKTNLSVLKNKIKVVSENWRSETCTVGLWMDIGSRCEQDNNNGVAHFLEHMYFKGTSNRDHQKIQAEAMKRGVTLKSHMTREMISIYANCQKDDIDWAIGLLGEIITQPKYDDAIIEKEKHVILNEMENIERNYREVVFDYLHATAYQGTPLSRSILGTQENVENMTSKTLMDFQSNFFKAPRMTLVGVGDIDHDNLNTLAEKYLGSVSCTYENGIDYKLPCRFTASEIRDRDDALPLGHVAIGFHGPSAADSDSVALWIATAINGSYDKTYGGTRFTASKLAAVAFSSDDLQSFENFYLPYYDTSLWGYYFTSTVLGMQEVAEYIVGQVVRLSTNITSFEVNRAKNQLKTHILLSQNGTENISDEIGRQVCLYGRRISPEEMLTRIDMVTTDNIREVCMKHLYDKSPSIAGFGPIEGLPDINLISSKTWWFRY